MKPFAIVLSINASLATVVILMLWTLFDVAKLSIVGCGAITLLNLALAVVFLMSKEKNFSIAFLLGFSFMAVVTGALLYVIFTYFPGEMELLRSREI